MEGYCIDSWWVGGWDGPHTSGGHGPEVSNDKPRSQQYQSITVCAKQCYVGFEMANLYTKLA